jgi:hypothetical protein
MLTFSIPCIKIQLLPLFVLYRSMYFLFCIVLCIVYFVSFYVLFVLYRLFCIVLCIFCFVSFYVLFILYRSMYYLYCIVLCIVCFVLFYVLFVLCRSIYCLFCIVLCIFLCKCVLYYCHRVLTQLQLTNISYHIEPVIADNFFLKSQYYNTPTPTYFGPHWPNIRERTNFSKLIQSTVSQLTTWRARAVPL